jgi:formylglycine-generating enzyme required for sulfatase activity/uncharacterized caspase-like protein
MRTLILSTLLLTCFAQDRRVTPALQTPRRLALIVGNGAYPTSPLRNPVNDARALADTLRQSSFAVTVAENTDLRKLDQAVGTFASSLRAGDVALFYYSGHGMQLDGENYLVPVDFHADQESEVPYQAYSAGRVLERLQGSGAALSILILDACRDNPFRTTRSAAKGLAAMNTGKGSFIAFSTGPGQTASDNQRESNGLFTKYLLEALREPDLKLGDVFDRVRGRVYEASGGKQLPWTASSVIGTFVFRDMAAISEQIAREEAALRELERQVADARQRNAAREEAEKQREAAALRERLKFDEAERERQRLSQPKPQPVAPRQDDEARLAELRRKREESASELQRLSTGTMTLEEARREVATLEGKVAEIRKRIDAAQAESLRQLDAEYAPGREKLKQVAARDMFETTQQYQARLAKQKAAQEEFEKKYQADRRAAEDRYAAELQEESKDYLNRIEELKRGTYPLAGAKLEFAGYDADRGQMTVKIDGEQYQLAIASDKARALYANLHLSKVEAGFGNEIVVFDPSSGERFGAKGLPRAGDLTVNPKDGLKYVWIPPGTFAMGCSPGDSECGTDEKPAPRVTITKGFWMGQTEVTQEAYQRVIGKNPSHFQGARLPVETVSWNEAQAYCRAVGMRLPTEAEWEYAARGGDASSRYGELDAVAWHAGNSGSQTHEVARKQSNRFGLYDVLGNVWEWVADWYADYSEGFATDPQAAAGGEHRVLRGGSWYFDPRSARASYRNRVSPGYRSNNIGLRCAGEL